MANSKPIGVAYTDQAIVGGTIDSTPIGATTVSTVAASTISATGQITSTVASGTAPLVVASTTAVSNLNAEKLSGATFAAPGTIGGGTAGAGTFTNLTVTGVTTIGNAASDTFGVYGATPVVQRATAATHTTIDTTVSVSTTSAIWGFSTSTQANAAIAAIAEIQATLVAIGIWAA